MIYIVRCSDTKEGNRHSFANHVGQTDQIVSPKGIKVSVLKCWAFLVQGTSKMLQFRDELGFETTERPCEWQRTHQMDSWLAIAGWVGCVGWLQKSGRRWMGAGPHCGFGVHLQPAAYVWRCGSRGRQERSAITGRTSEAAGNVFWSFKHEQQLSESPSLDSSKWFSTVNKNHPAISLLWSVFHLSFDCHK